MESSAIFLSMYLYVHLFKRNMADMIGEVLKRGEEREDLEIL
jgi:hypothetical protein